MRIQTYPRSYFQLKKNVTRNAIPSNKCGKEKKNLKIQRKRKTFGRKRLHYQQNDANRSKK